MRIKQYLNDETRFIKDKVVTDETLINIIKKKCLPFLKENKGGKLLWRGSRWDIENIKILTPRQNRLPMDTPERIHNFVDDIFKKKYGWKARSEGVFVTSNRKEAQDYGNIGIFFPIGKFNYLYNNKIRDFTENLKNSGIISFDDIDAAAYKEFWKSPPDEDELKEINQLRDNLINTIRSYEKTNLSKASRSDIEIIFKCEHYYLIRPKKTLFTKLQDLL